jgi:hypothetical protein
MLLGLAQAATPSLEEDYQQAARAGFRLGVQALDAVDASPQQRRAVERLGHSLASSLRPLAQDCEVLARDMAQAWVSPTVERQVVEDLRHDTIAALDAASEPVAAFLVDAGDVLTQEQRQALLDAAVARFWDRAR